MLCVSGSRDADKAKVYWRVKERMEEYADRGINKLLSGHCNSGIDEVAEKVAADLGWTIEEHPADWEKHGKSAGPKRNAEMIKREPSAVLAFTTRNSVGTNDLIDKARKAGIEVTIIDITNYCIAKDKVKKEKKKKVGEGTDKKKATKPKEKKPKTAVVSKHVK